MGVAAEITQWIDPSGATTLLDVDWQASGRYMPAVKHEEFGVPGQPGARRQRSRHDVHEFTIRVVLSASSEPTLRQEIRDLVSVFNPLEGEGLLRVTSPIGDVREIQCIYANGLGMDESPGMSGMGTQKADVTLRAYDPYWRDTSDISSSFTIGVVPTFFPIFPLRLTSSQIAVDDTVVNAGDVETWPVWTITGPGSTIYLRNLRTGQVIDLNADGDLARALALAAGEQVTIDTRPSTATSTGKTVLLDDGTNRYSALSAASDLWALQKGSNAIRLEMAGAVAGQSSLSVAYKQRYLSP